MVKYYLGLDRNDIINQHDEYTNNLECDPYSMLPLCQKLNLQSFTSKSSHSFQYQHLI